MTASDFRAKPQVPDTLKHLNADVAVEVLSRSEAAAELGVASADLRRLLWARPQLADAAAEIEERRLDKAERTFLKLSIPTIPAGAMRPACSPFATAIALAGEAGSRRAPARLS
jgi:hypothetical protein